MTHRRAVAKGSPTWLMVLVLVLAGVALTRCGGGREPAATRSATVTPVPGTPATVGSASSTPQPHVNLPQWNPEKRTGVEDVDAIIAAMTAGDSEPIIGRIKYEMNSCGPSRPAPTCPAGKEAGTLVESISVEACAHYYLSEADVPAFMRSFVPGNPYVVFRDTSGMRQLIFDRETDGGTVSRVTLTNGGQIIGLAVSCTSGKAGDPGRFDMLKEAQAIYPYAPDRFILPPPK